MADDEDDQIDPWREGKRGIVRGIIWSLVISAVVWWFWG